MRLGIISDTHGLLRPEVFDVFSKVDRIIHAGDVGKAEILDDLEALAPVTAVFGNVDGFAVRRRTTDVVHIELDDARFVITHGHLLGSLGSPTPEKLKARWPDADVIVYGHTHDAVIRDFPDFSVVINPGSAGPKRFTEAVTVAIMETEPGIPPRARIVELLK